MGQNAASFRDPAGFMYQDKNGKWLRQINQVGAADFELLNNSGLYKDLTDAGLLVRHRLAPDSKKSGPGAHAVIAPEPIPFVSYPFEWSFSQLQDAALLTLEIQERALAHGMTLKDASAYNVQFLNGKPIFIDTLSFEAYSAGVPWQAYRQFCQHFLAPLSLMAYSDLNLNQLLRVHLDGIPLELVAKLLPTKTRLKPGLGIHLFLHAKAQAAKASDHRGKRVAISQTNLEAILASLQRTITSLRAPKSSTEWADYYDKTNYSDTAAKQKQKLLQSFLKSLKPKTAIDLGGNNGRYSRPLNALGVTTVCTDIDPNAVEDNYRTMKTHNETKMLPLLVDLTNPGGGLGWQNSERPPIHQRVQTDLAVALALVHHLAISNNLPLGSIADYFSKFAPYLIIEFVPKEDSQVQKLLSSRKDIFPGYTKRGFEQAFAKRYTLVTSSQVKGTKRTLYLFKKK